MEIRTVSPMNLFCYTAETTITDVGQFVRTTPLDVYRAAINAGMEVLGPQYWIYNGFDGNPNTRFILQIGVPVDSITESVAGYSVVAIPATECAIAVHEGAWNELAASYEKLIGEVLASGRSLGGIAREAYLHIDFNNPENCRTEIQLGLLPK